MPWSLNNVNFINSQAKASNTNKYKSLPRMKKALRNRQQLITHRSRINHRNDAPLSSIDPPEHSYRNQNQS